MSYKFNPFTGTLDDVGPNNGNGVHGGVFGGDVDLTWNKTSNLLTVGGDINLNDGGTFTTTLQTITPTANRTISLPDATGTVALVAGSSGQLVYNNAGAQAGAPGSVVGATGDITLTLNGAASTPPLGITGTWFTGGTSTTTKPQVLIEPAGTTSTAWSTSGTGLGVNATSGFTGRLLDLQVNGTSRAVVTGAGSVGIGVSAPSELVHLGSGGKLRFNRADNTTGTTIHDGGNAGFILNSLNNDHFVFQMNGTEKVRIQSVTGNVGIGTTSPSSLLHLADAGNITVGTTTGTKIGTATTQKLGFYNKTPVVQPVAVADATTAVDVITQLNALLARMRDLGLIAT